MHRAHLHRFTQYPSFFARTLILVGLAVGCEHPQPDHPFPSQAYPDTSGRDVALDPDTAGIDDISPAPVGPTLEPIAREASTHEVEPAEAAPFRDDPHKTIAIANDLRPSDEEPSPKPASSSPEVALVPNRATEPAKKTEPSSVAPASPQRRCLSLRELSKHLGDVRAGKTEIRRDALNLAGISHVEGILADPENKDVILVGKVLPGRPALHLDDLTAFLAYVSQQNRTYIHCSLDPTPEGIRNVQQVMSSSPSLEDSDEFESWTQQLKKAIGPQCVRVGGVHRSSRAAWAMIISDYIMKKHSLALVDAVSVPSPMDRSIAAARKAFEAGRQAPGGSASMSRFWFHLGPKSPVFEEDDGIIWLKTCRVVVLTEAQAASADGRLRDAGRKDPDALQWAADYSRALPNMSSHYPLIDRYRLLGVLKAMVVRRFSEQAGLDLTILRTHRCAPARIMPESFPGLANAIALRHEGQRVIRYYAAVACGGVSMQVTLRANAFVHSAAMAEFLPELRTQAVLASPKERPLWWAIAS